MNWNFVYSRKTQNKENNRCRNIRSVSTIIIGVTTRSQGLRGGVEMEGQT
jgi:hypothetical protein